MLCLWGFYIAADPDNVEKLHEVIRMTSDEEKM